MKILGYEVSNKTIIVNGIIVAGMLIVLPPVIYSIYNANCGNITYDTTAPLDAATQLCDYLQDRFSSLCPSGFPSLFDMCVEGFQEGFQAVSQGVQNFVPSVLNETVCNNYFGNNHTLTPCYDALDDECWKGAFAGFSWKESAVALVNNLNSAISNHCEHAASLGAGALAGLTLFAGAVTVGVNALLGRQKLDEEEQQRLAF